MSRGDRHIWDVNPQLRSTAALHMWLAQLAFLICSGFTKVSILFFYRRIVSGTYSRKWYWFVWFAIGFTVAASGVRTYWLIVTIYNGDVTRNTFNLMVWAQFELQAGIICASAPALRVFFRRYLGGGVEDSRRSNNALGTITVIRNTSVTFDKDGSVMRPSEKKQFYELRNLSAEEQRSEKEGEDGSSCVNRDGELLTCYEHKEDSVGLSDVSQSPWNTSPAGTRRAGRGRGKGEVLKDDGWGRNGAPLHDDHELSCYHFVNL